MGMRILRENENASSIKELWEFMTKTETTVGNGTQSIFLTLPKTGKGN